MSTEKVSLTIGREELRHARLIASRRRSSLSSVLTEALRDHAEAQARREAAADVLRTFDARDRASPQEMQDLLQRWAMPGPSPVTGRSRPRVRKSGS